MEREQALKLFRCFLEMPNSLAPTLITREMAAALVSVAEMDRAAMTDDKLCRVCLETLCEMGEGVFPLSN